MKTRMYVCILVILIFSLCTQYSIAEDFDWPRWRGPNGDGLSSETEWDPAALAGGPNILWKADVGAGYSNVAIKDNRLYAMGLKERKFTLFCLNAENGKEIWRYQFEHLENPQSTPTVHGKRVYALSKDGVLLCLNAKNGKLQWKKDLVSEYDAVRPFYGFAASPVIDENLIILTVNISGLALDKKTGKMVWGSDKPSNIRMRNSTGTVYATPVLYDYEGTRYATISNYAGLHSVEVNTGKVLWTYEWDPKGSTCFAYATGPVIFDNKVFITRDEKEGCVLLDIGDGTPRVIWDNLSLSSDTSAPVLIDGYIYGCEGGPGIGRGSLRCLDVETGEMMWEKDFRTEEDLKVVTVSLIAADGKLIILEDDGTLHVAQATPASYQEISSCDVLEGKRTTRHFWIDPVLCNGLIYCRNHVGDLVCIDVRK